MTEGDLIGLPKTDQEVTSFCPPDWFFRACNEPVLLFLDEIDRATTEVRQGIFELCDSRKIYGQHLHKDTVIFAAVNGGDSISQYQVAEMDPAELSRWSIFDLQPTIEDWLVWATGKVETIVWDFVNQHRDSLEHQKDYEPNKVYPSRRSWKRFNDCLKGSNFVKVKNLDGILHLGTSFLGFETAVEFRKFVKDYEHVVTAEDIVNDGLLHKTDKYKIDEHNALLDKILNSGLLEKPCSEKQVANIALYLVKLPAECGMKLFRNLPNKNQKNFLKIHQYFDSAGKQIVADYISYSLTGVK
jgi:hypothetical protein